MRLIIIALILLLGAACLLLGAPVEEMLEKYSAAELAIGLLACSVMFTLPLWAPFVLFRKVF